MYWYIQVRIGIYGWYIYPNIYPPRPPLSGEPPSSPNVLQRWRRAAMSLSISLYVHKQYEGLFRDSPWSNPTTESILGVKFGLGGVERNGSPWRGIPKV